MPAKLVLVRIDDRLIHGQVAVGWAKAVNPDVLVVANDAAADDSLQRNLMELAAPPPLQVTLCRAADLAAWIRRPEFEGKRLLILFATPQDVWRAVEKGFEPGQINIGGMRFAPGKKQILKAVSIDESDIETFRRLRDRGLRITVQMVPTDEPLDISRYLAPG